MSEMVERVARAMFEAEERDYLGRELSWKFGGVRIQQKYRERAETAIAAMREPTEAMVDARLQYSQIVEASSNAPTVAGGWRAMIDEALR